MEETNFTVAAAIDTGIGTAFSGSLGLGLIPVGYTDIEGSEDDSCLSKSFTVSEIIAAIRSAGSKTTEWCAKASLLNLQKYKQRYEPESFNTNFKHFLDTVIV